MPEKNRFLEAALFYARRLGWPVLPVKPGQKAPPLTKNGSLDASTDEKQIYLWWERCAGRQCRPAHGRVLLGAGH